MKNPKMITCIDSGEWSNALGFSSPRMYTPLRELEANGRLRIASIKYIRSPVIDRRFPEEEKPEAAKSKDVYKLRHDTRREVERERVRLTTQNFRINANVKEFNPAEKKISPIVCVNMRPGKSADQSTHRNDLLTDLIKNENVERVLLAPPYFASLDELEQIEEIDQDSKILLWTPYRYAAGIIYARQVLEKTALGGASLNVISGPFEIKRFISEFSLQFLSAFLSLTGDVLKQDDGLKLSIQLSAPNGLPVLSISAKHTSDATSAILLSTAGGSFGNIDHATIKLLFIDMSHIDLSNSLIIYNHRTPDQHFSNGRSHDPPRSTLNGSRYLLNACLSETQMDDPPTLSRFKRTQEVIDELVRSTSAL